MFDLKLYDNDKTVTERLKDNRIWLQPSVGGEPYTLDRHYAEYVLDSITGIEDAQAMIDKLNEDAKRHGATQCTKAMCIESYLNKDFWTESVSRIRSAISHNRRVMCACHETGSFAPRERWW